MVRFLTILVLAGTAGVASAQVTGTPRSATQSPESSLATETRRQEEAFAAWKVRYADNRAKVVNDIKVVKQEIAAVDPARATLKQQLADLLNGSVRRWNEEKTDFADPEQFAGCQSLFGTIRQAIRDGVLKL